MKLELKKHVLFFFFTRRAYEKYQRSEEEYWKKCYQTQLELSLKLADETKFNDAVYEKAKEIKLDLDRAYSSLKRLEEDNVALKTKVESLDIQLDLVTKNMADIVSRSVAAVLSRED